MGGAQRLLADLLPRLNKHVHTDLLVFAAVENDLTEKLRSEGVEIRVLQASLHNPLTAVRLRRVIREYDVLHVHLFPSLYMVALANVGLGRRLIWTEHSTSNSRRTRPYFRPIERLVYACYDRIVSISEQVEVALRGWVEAKEGDSRFIVIQNGVDLSRFSLACVQHDYPHTLIMVSRFVASKDQDTVIRAMRLLADDVHLVLVGDGPRLEACKSLAIETDVAHRVHFLGTRSDIPQLIAKADIGVQSSHWEGFGLTAVEIMASERPVVAADVEGLRQVVEGAGVLFPQGDEKALAEQLNRLLTDKDYYAKTADSCKRRSVEYSIELMTERYLSLYV